MQAPQPIFVICPVCGEPCGYSQGGIAYKTLHDVYWSDGLIVGPMYVDIELIVTAEVCGHSFWYQDATQYPWLKIWRDWFRLYREMFRAREDIHRVRHLPALLLDMIWDELRGGELNWGALPALIRFLVPAGLYDQLPVTFAEMTTLPELSCLLFPDSAAEWGRLARQLPGSDPARQLALCLRWWWALNQPRRQQPPGPVDEGELQRCLAEILLLTDGRPEHLLFRIEAFRELGFDMQAKRLLAEAQAQPVLENTFHLRLLSELIETGHRGLGYITRRATKNSICLF